MADSSRVAVVTGGASGIGRATCRHLAQSGHRVAVLDLDGDGAEYAAKELQADGHDAVAVTVDVADPASVEAGFAAARHQLGPVNVLVTSAGLVAWDDFVSIAPERWNKVVAVNLTGTFLCAQQALTDMIPAKWGRIITIASSSAQRGSPRMAHYAAAKGGVIALTKSLAREYAPLGITANTIPPSGIETPMQHGSQARGLLPPNEVMAKTIPLGRLGTPDDIAAAAAFLASDAANFITGQVLGVNGGSVL